MLLHITQNSNSINCLITIIPKQNFYICKFLNITSLIPLLRLPSKCFSWHWVSKCERMSFLLQLILTPQKADDSHCIIFLMHSFIKYIFFLVCIWAVLVSHTWSPELLNWHFLEIFTHDKTAKLPHCCLAWYQWLHIPHVFQSWLWIISQGFKADDKHRNYIVWLNKITEYVKIHIQ